MNVTIKICKHNINGFDSCEIMEDGVCVQGPCHAEELVEYAPVVHGRFVHIGPRFAGGVDWWNCSICDSLVSGAETRFVYCPHCGAKMDGGGSDGR